MCIRDSVGMLDAPKEISNWIMTEVMRALNEQGISITDFRVSPEMLTGLIALIGRGRISGSMAKEVFAEMASTGHSAEEIVSSRGVGQISDEETLKAVAGRIIDANPAEARK